MAYEDDDETEGPGAPPAQPSDKKKLKQRISDLKMDKRVGKWVGDPDNPTRGIYKAPRSEQREYRKTIKQKIRNLRSGLPEDS